MTPLPGFALSTFVSVHLHLIFLDSDRSEVILSLPRTGPGLWILLRVLSGIQHSCCAFAKCFKLLVKIFTL